jgi:hypothetical protein
MPIRQIEQADMEEALLAFIHFREVQTAVPEDEIQKRLDAGEAPGEIFRSVLEQMDFGAIAEGLRRLREAVGLTDDATRAFWMGLTDLGVDHEIREVETAAFIGLFLGARASQAAVDRAS